MLFDITVKKIIGFEPDSPMTKELRKNYELFFKGLISFPLCVPGTKFYQSIQVGAYACAAARLYFLFCYKFQSIDKHL